MSIQAATVENESEKAGRDRKMRPALKSASAYTYYASQQRKNGREAAQRSYKSRLLAEQAEARALGVEVVQKRVTTNVWSDEECDVLRMLYPDYNAMQEKLPGRSYSSIRGRCQYIGLQQKKKTHATWTAQEISRLKKAYPVVALQELLAAFPNKTGPQIRMKGVELRLLRPKRKYVSTGNALCDEIRRRAFELNYSMADLDAMAGTGCYFSRRGWVSRPHSYTKMIRAIHALGGTETVDWGEPN